MKEFHFGVIKNFPNDIAHDLDINVARRLVTHITTKLGKPVRESLTKKLLSMNKYKPSEFHRRIRDDYHHWKAVEGKKFLKYWCFGALNDVGLTVNEYRLICTLALAINILSREDLHHLWSETKPLLSLFVEGFPEMFGAHHRVCSLHKMIHLADEAENHGALYKYSCYPFETYMGTIGKLVTHSKKNPLTQIYYRSIELNIAQEILISRSKSTHKLISRGDEIKKIIHNSFTISTEPRDSFFKLKNGKIIKVMKIVGEDWDNISLTVMELKLEMLFDIPLNPEIIELRKWKYADYVGSYFSVYIEDLDQKCAVMPHDAPDENGAHKYFTCMPFTGFLNEVL